MEVIRIFRELEDGSLLFEADLEGGYEIYNNKVNDFLKEGYSIIEEIKKEDYVRVKLKKEEEVIFIDFAVIELPFEEDIPF